eukprot:1146636-Pelagomonas_calceolata.AAC.5
MPNAHRHLELCTTEHAGSSSSSVPSNQIPLSAGSWHVQARAQGQAMNRDARQASSESHHRKGYSHNATNEQHCMCLRRQKTGELKHMPLRTKNSPQSSPIDATGSQKPHLRCYHYALFAMGL